MGAVVWLIWTAALVVVLAVWPPLVLYGDGVQNGGPSTVTISGTPSVNVNGVGATVNVACLSGCSGSAGTSSSNIIQLNGTALGNPSNYGTSPGTVSVIGVNSFVTNTPSVNVANTPAVTISGTPSVNVNGIGATVNTAITGTPSVNVNGIGATVTTSISGTPSVNVNGIGATVTVSRSNTAADNIVQWNSIALGSPSNYGTSPGVVSVIGANAFVTNTPSVNVANTPAVTISGTPSVNVNGIGATVTTSISGTPSVNVNGIGATVTTSISGTPSVNVNGIGALVNVGTVAQVPSGALAVNIEPAKATTSTLIAPIADLVGKQIISPYAGREVQLRGQNFATSTTLATIISAQPGYKIYVTDLECGRDDAGTTAITVTVNDTVSTQLVLPNTGGGGGNNKSYGTPLVLATGVTLQFAMSTNTTNVRCGATGFYGY